MYLLNKTIHILKTLKKSFKFLYIESKWLAVIIYANFAIWRKYRLKEEKVLILPAADLNGGFGEDLMIYSFISNCRKGINIEILTNDIIKRDDYLSDFPNVNYIGGFKTGNYFYLLKIIKKYSELVVFGADVLDGFHSFHNSADRLRLLLLANKYGIKCRLVGFSINNFVPKRIKKMFKKVSDFCTLNLREIDSYNRTLKLLKYKENIQLTADIAFLSKVESEFYETDEFKAYKHWINTCCTQKTKIVAFCPNAYLAAKTGLTYHLDIFEEALKVLTKTKEEYAFLFLYHDLRPQINGMSDREISETLFSKYNEYFKCYYTPKIKNGIQLKAFLQYITFSVSGRMHLGISGITFGKPMFGISYQDKFSGLYELFKLNDIKCYVNYNEKEYINKTLTIYINKFDEICQKVNENLEEIVTLSKKNL